MKFALISDLHLDFINATGIQTMADHICLNTKDVDFIINAGDTYENFLKRDQFYKKLSKPVIEVLGNHDFYHSSGDMTLKYLPELKMVTATLWTNFGENPLTELYSTKGIADFCLINFWSANNMKQSYYETIEFIERHSPDIVVTHFGCHLNSIHPQYEGSDLKRYFINDCSSTINKVKPKIWCHGHTHSAFDYTVGSTRILCNPFGYPGENFNQIEKYPIVKFEV